MTTPWDTNDGQKWLAKALNPAGFQSVDLKGLPDQEAHNVVVLNYQSQYAIEPPAMYNAVGTDYSTYESEILCYQDPVVFGVSASYPTGTLDPLHDNKIVHVKFGSAAAGHLAPPSITFNSTGSIFPRTCKTFINTQLGGGRDIDNSYAALKDVAQRHRVIYGAIQAIPTCSQQDNSGTIAVSQQPFIGDNLNNQVSRGIGYGMAVGMTEEEAGQQGTLHGVPQTGTRIYTAEDFPDAEDTIRNPAALLTRFYDGCYAPYKLKNPFQEDFITTSDNVTTMAPFWTVGAAYRLYGSEAWVPMDWDVSAKSFVPPKNGDGNRPNVQAQFLKMSLMSKTGALKEIVFCNWDATALPGAQNRKTGLFEADVDILFMGLLNNYTYEGTAGLLADNNSDSTYEFQFTYNGTPQTTGGENPEVVKNCHTYRCGDAGTPRARLPNSNMCSIISKAMNMRGNITILIRMGVEVIVTAASAYSPFNHRSPQYDEAALKSYLKIVHRMSDGFYGNAASDTFHTGLYQWIINNLYTSDETVDFANRGAYWRGVLSAA